MSTKARKGLGAAVLVVGWSLVVAGGALIITAVTGGDDSRDQRTGLGLAVIMAGLLVVLAGNYIHHRALVASGSDDDHDAGDHGSEPGGPVEP